MVPRVPAHDQQLDVRDLHVRVAASLLPGSPRGRDPSARLRPAPSEGIGDDPTPLELIGIDRPFTAGDLREIDRGIGLARGLDGHLEELHS